MSRIDLTINRETLAKNVRKARENNVIIPTFHQMQNPESIPAAIQEKLKSVGLWDVNPLNLFRITWKNEAKESGGLFQAVPNYIELPPELTGVPCRIIAMVGKWFPRAATRWGPPSAASPPGWSPASLTWTGTRPSGPPPATTAGAARSTPSSWGPRAWPSSRRR